MVEKNISAKTQALLKRRETELSELRENSLRSEETLRNQIQDVSIREQDLEHKLEQITQEHGVLVKQRNLLREEAATYRRKAQDLTTQNSKQHLALKSLNEFFKSQTLAKVR